MKKTQFIDATRNIRKRFVSFLSIVFIIMLGTGGFFMARYTARSVAVSATKYYEQQNFKDYELASSIGITETDLKRLSEVEGIKSVEGAVVLDGSMYKDEISQGVTLISWTDQISMPELIDGRRPEKQNECAVSEDLAHNFNIVLGDQLELSSNDIYNVNPLKSDSFTVTAIVHHPDYVRSSTTWTVILPLNAFNREGMENRYTRAFLCAENADQNNMFYASYDKSIKDTTARLRALLPELENNSVEDTKRMMNERIDAEWAKAEEQIKDAEQQIADGEAQLESQLASAKAQLASAKAQLENGRQQLLNGEAKLRDAEALLAAVKEVKALFNGIDNSAMLNYLHTSIGMIDAYEYASTPEEKAYAHASLLAYLNAPENNGYAEAIKIVYGTDIREQAKDPNSLPAVRDTLRETCGIIMLMDASDNGISPADILSDVARLDSLLNAIDTAPDDASREAARQKLIEFISDPDVQTRLAIADFYLGLNLQEVVNISVYNSTLDAQALASLRSAFAQVRAARNTILNAESMVAQGRAQLNSGWAMYYDGLRQVREKEQEMLTLEAEARQKIADARKELADKIKEGEAQLAEARAQADQLTCNWIIQERIVNPGFVDVQNNVRAASKMGYAMGGLFLLVASLVCFSTLVIIIEEERKLVGTTKAFGFRNNEILAKYMFFAVSGSVLGALLGIGMGTGITIYVEHLIENTMMYIFPLHSIKIDIGVTLLVCIGAVLICAVVTLIACTDLLRTPAYYLMNGTTNNNNKKKTPKKATNQRGSLYSRLVIRNMVNEKARVLISIIIIAGGCSVVGVGLSMKYAFEGMTKKQVSDVTIYDYRVNFDSSVTEEERSELENAMDNAGVRYITATYSPNLFEKDNKLRGLYLLCAESDELNDFIQINNNKTGKPMTLPEDGVLIQYRMKESYGVSAGDTLTIYDSTLNRYDTQVVDYFRCYLGRMAVCSSAGYRKIFGRDPVPNCYYVLLNNTDRASFETLVSSASGNFVAERADYFLDSLSGTFMLYNVIVIISIAIAVIMSFIILTNLANIFLNRKKKELIVMRINGFSIRQAINYLTKETIVTSVAGLLLGVLIGIFLTPHLLRIIEPADCIFIRSTHWKAWLIATLMEGAFTIIINASVFHKVHKLNFHEIM